MPGFAVQGLGGFDRVAVPTREFLYNYTWELYQIFEDRDHVLVYAKDMTLPTFTVGIEKQQGASLNYKFAKDVTWDDIKVTFYDSVGLISVMKRWRERVWTALQGLAMADSYKKITTMAVYTPEWQLVRGQLWNLVGSWPSTIRHGDLTYTGSDVKVVEVTVSYDYADETS